MSILSRAKDILSSNINAVLDKCEDPEKMVNQMLRKARENLAEVKQETGAVMANETTAKRKLDECAEDIKKYENAAMNAVKSGNDTDARKLLAEKQRLESKLAGLQENYNAAHQDAVTMKQMFDKLSEEISDLENRADVIKSKNATAKARESVNKMTAGMGNSSSLDAFERMEAKADKRLDTAQAVSELNGAAKAGEDLLAKYGSGSVSSVDDELAAMKAKLAGGQGG